MTELDLIVDLHANTERQGPGSPEATLKALDMVDFPPDENLQVADLGCGTGGQTLTLAKHMNAYITGLDLFPAFLEELKDASMKLGLQNKIEVMEKSMDELPFDKESLDLIWSEGAIYNLGFENGIKLWRDFLKPGGYLAVSEITWITSERPQEIEGFWNAAYPEIDRASNKIKLLEENGYTLSGYFYLDQDCWLKNYYEPIENSLDAFLERNKHSELAKKVAEDYRNEIAVYRKFKDYYSYGFYIARKNE